MSTLADVRALSAVIQPQLQTVVTTPPLLPTAAQRVVDKALKKLMLSQDKSVADMTRGLRILPLYDRRDQCLDAARILKDVPFTGNKTIYEPIIEVFCLAIRLSAGTPEGGAVLDEFSPHILGPYDSATFADLRVRAATQRRLDGGLLRQPRLKPTPTASVMVQKALLELNELDFMWALGGSNQWPRARIEEEIAGNEDYIRSFPGM